jgi:hypothetical protein
MKVQYVELQYVCNNKENSVQLSLHIFGCFSTFQTKSFPRFPGPSYYGVAFIPN